MFAYDASSEPTIPKLPTLKVHLTHPRTQSERTEIEAIVDTGADQSCIPERLFGQLRLNHYTEQRVRDFNGQIITLRRARINLMIECDIDTWHPDIEVLLIEGDEAIIGRDILNQYKLVLNAPLNKWGIDCSCTEGGCVLSNNVLE